MIHLRDRNIQSSNRCNPTEVVGGWSFEIDDETYEGTWGQGKKLEIKCQRQIHVFFETGKKSQEECYVHYW